jgi:hypothetical protein
MNLRTYIQRFFYSFPVQLVVMHFKKNQIMMLYWLMMFGFVTQTLAMRFGIPYLFLDPEYMGHVSYRAYFIMGVSLGAFIMAFNISSFILNSFHFPFLATLSKTFIKYCYNNFIIPLTFILTYCIAFFHFQHDSQLKASWDILMHMAVFLLGIVLVVAITFRYFMYTNKDIYKLFGVEHGDNDSRSPAKPHKHNKVWRVDTYIVYPFKAKLVRDTRHYKKFMLERVFRQNHLNAAVIEIVVFVTFILLGLLRDYPIFRLPAGASILLLFTMLIMLSGVFRYWLRAWANTALVLLFLGINFISKYETFNPRNQAYGLDYSSKAPYTRETLEAQVNDSILRHDKAHNLEILERWKAKWAEQGVNKPKMLLINVSGGGLRSCVFTFRTLQMIDSTYQGNLMPATTFISGSSGGMISAIYYRQLYLKDSLRLNRANRNFDNSYLKNTGKDMLNSVVFSATVADLFLNMQQFPDGPYRYVKDRAYAWEEQLTENTNHVMNVRLKDLYKPEYDARIPIAVISPTILNDGRALQIAAQPVSYLLHSPQSDSSKYAPVANGVEFSRFFARQNAENLHLSSALRMNSSFPYIMPPVSLPSEPALEVMDAGIRDNYGLLNSIQYLYTFRDWIAENTSGVIILQIRDTQKRSKVEDNSIRTYSEKLLAPMRNVSGNFLIMQDYQMDKLLEYAGSWFNGPLDLVLFQMPESETKISLSWHLTQREKNYLKSASLNEENKVSLEKLKRLMPPEINMRQVVLSAE